MIDKDSPTAGGMRAIDVAPAIADDKSSFQIDVPGGGGAKEHPGPGFPAIAGFPMARSRVVTDFNGIDRRHGGAKHPVDGVDGFPALSSATDIGLVRHND